MKRLNILTKVLVTLFALIATSCIDHYKITTKVNKDGSLIRTISITGDSGCWDDSKMIIPNDSLWKTDITWTIDNEQDTNSDKTYTYTSSRTFKNISELNGFLQLENDTSGMMDIKADLKKTFKWFYTFFTYTESFKKGFPFNHYPIEDFLSERELRYFYDDNYTYVRELDSLVFIEDLEQMPQLTPVDSSRIEEIEIDYYTRFGRWQALNVYEEYLKLIADIKPEISLSNEEKSELLINSKLVESYLIDNEDDDPKSLDMITAYFNLTDKEIRSKRPVKSEVFFKKLELANSYWASNNTIYNQVELPGMLIQTNADSISNSTSFWEYNENRFFANDFIIQAESRIVNQWAFILTGVVVIVLLSLLIISFIRK